MICNLNLPKPALDFDDNVDKKLFNQDLSGLLAMTTVYCGYVKAFVYTVQMVANRTFSLASFALIITYTLPAIFGTKKEITITDKRFGTSTSKTVNKLFATLGALSIATQVLDVVMYAASSSWQRTAMKCALSPAVCAIILGALIVRSD